MVYLDATDELLRDRVMNLPEKVIQEHNYEQDHFLGRLSKYRENNAESDTVLQYFDEIDILPLHIGSPFVSMYACTLKRICQGSRPSRRRKQLVQIRRSAGKVQLPKSHI